MYYIIEHPRRGVLFSMDRTPTSLSSVGRFSPTRGRHEAHRFATGNAAENARQQITSADPDLCIVMRSPAAKGGAWERVLVGPVEEPRV